MAISIATGSEFSSVGPVRLTGRGRLALRLLAVAIAVLVVAPVLAATSPVSANTGVDGAVVVERAPGVALERQGRAQLHVVRPGDTLWELAVGVTPAGADPRLVVAEIMRLSGRSDASLAIGDRLYLPLPDQR